MATILRAWNIVGDVLEEVPELPASDLGLIEGKLEDWLASQPDAIQDNLLIIGRQVHTTSGPLDLLGLTAEGKVVVIELKRDRAPRETVAQAIDYASWVAAQTPEHIKEIARDYLHGSLDEAFRERFDSEALPDLDLDAPGVLVVASRLDASTERMIEYLSARHGMDIDGLVFRYLRLSDDREILVRTSVVSEVERISKGGESYRVRLETLVAMAEDRRVVPLLTVLRRLAGFLTEDPSKSYGGSFRYWQDRMLCGVNVAANWGAPEGVIDVWFSYGAWAQMTGLSEDALLETLRPNFTEVRNYERGKQIVLRIASEQQATRFIDILAGWAVGPDSHGARPETDGAGQQATAGLEAP